MPASLLVTDETPAALAAEIERAGAGAERVARWRTPREGYRPIATAARDADGAVIAAVLTSARPATAATKIVDLWWRDAAAADALLAGVVETARERGDVAVKWQDADDELAHAHGFAPLRAPWAAVGTESTRGAVRWLETSDHDEPGYYAQTTLFTCGAVAGLIATERHIDGFTGSADDRDRELALWRNASNYPACEPVGLAVALNDAVSAAVVEVALDLAGPALLEDFTGFDYDFRAELQQDSLRQAGERGVPVRRDRVEVEEIVRRVAAGERALLLIDEAPMHGEVGPHWVTAHAVVGDCVVIEDPWINVDAGETWVDTHELPVPPADLDRLVRWGETGYRGVIFIDVR
ncbi:peptidase C39 family protein [Microbacterium koreense]|uniref:Peptidase C39 family protein n=2 Tax=Microbacterium koreense TaxID=323761 RepID=A0ABW2ZU75_9MICO